MGCERRFEGRRPEVGVENGGMWSRSGPRGPFSFSFFPPSLFSSFFLLNGSLPETVFGCGNPLFWAGRLSAGFLSRQALRGFDGLSIYLSIYLSIDLSIMFSKTGLVRAEFLL